MVHIQELVGEKYNYGQIKVALAAATPPPSPVKSNLPITPKPSPHDDPPSLLVEKPSNDTSSQPAQFVPKVLNPALSGFPNRFKPASIPVGPSINSLTLTSVCSFIHLVSANNKAPPKRKLPSSFSSNPRAHKAVRFVSHKGNSFAPVGTDSALIDVPIDTNAFSIGSVPSSSIQAKHGEIDSSLSLQTPEQKRLIEENRKKAMERRAVALAKRKQ